MDRLRKTNGLVYCQECRSSRPRIDSISLDWKLGFEIIYRVESNIRDERATEHLKAAVRKAFGLSDDHYSFDMPLSFWRIYWDQGELDLKLLEKCEKALDKVARSNNVALLLHGTIIIPRPIEYITGEIKHRKELTEQL